MIDDDNRLVHATLNGNIEAFGMLVEKYQNKMFNLALQITRDADTSKDITQDAFIKAYQKLKSFDTSKKFFSWIYRITLNETLNHKKHSRFSESLSEYEKENVHPVSENIEREETSIKVQNAINKLDDKYKSLIILKHYQELSYEEIAIIVCIPIAKVKSRLYIARENLRTSLESVYK
jgi:RNA polymerase sigma-70 factor (ECF subfamily)